MHPWRLNQREKCKLMEIQSRYSQKENLQPRNPEKVFLRNLSFSEIQNSNNKDTDVKVISEHYRLF